MKNRLLHSGIAVIVFLFALLLVSPAVVALSPHLDKSKIPQGCSGCHKGHGKRGTMMLDMQKDELCFKCHGPDKRGKRGEANTDVYSVIKKSSRHPVSETTRYHVHGEILPERDPSVPRHVSCYDCHNPHKAERNKSFKGVRGYSGKGVRNRTEAKGEYEICYLCHSDNANLPPESSNIARDFDVSNPSYHPIENLGKNRNVPSLSRKYSPTSIIACSDCHGNDDVSGPQGPHGSNYEFILKDRYDMQTVAESPAAYKLCYNCHERESIISDESFQAHKAHIVSSDSPCIACHDAHGSTFYPALIHFDEIFVTPNSLGELVYMPMIPGRPRCFLSCHVTSGDYEHLLISGQYCINNDTQCPPGW